MKMDIVWVVLLDGAVTVKQIIMPSSWEVDSMITDEIVGDLLKMK